MAQVRCMWMVLNIFRVVVVSIEYHYPMLCTYRTRYLLCLFRNISHHNFRPVIPNNMFLYEYVIKRHIITCHPDNHPSNQPASKSKQYLRKHIQPNSLVSCNAMLRYAFIPFSWEKLWDAQGITQFIKRPVSRAFNNNLI